MKAKLIKIDDVYRLVEVTKHGNSIIGTTDLDYQKSWSDRCQKLSLKNCQAIERGYDLDELADEFAKTKSSHSTFQNTHKRDFREGFQKALELMGDKKFSEDDMKAAYGKGFSKQGIKSFNLLIQSLQQTEWDVEVEMENVYSVNNGENEMMPKLRPVFDADGCLILKRINL